MLDPIPERPTTLSDMVESAIREAIVQSTLAPGDLVTEAGLAKELNVSKTPVREALLRLEYIGLITTDGRRGGRIVTPSVEQIRAAYELRTALEVQGVRILSERGPSEELLESRAIAEQCLAAAERHDREGFRELDRRFHLSLASALDDARLAQFIHDAFDLTWTLRRRDVPDAGDSETCARQHLDVMDAIDARDAAAADLAMRAHLTKVQGIVVAAFESLA